MTPRERLQRYADAATDPRAKAPYMAHCMDADGNVYELDPRDLLAVLSANAGYEQLMRDAAKEAVAAYKRELANELRNRLRKSGEMGAAAVIDDTADDLEDGTL